MNSFAILGKRLASSAMVLKSVKPAFASQPIRHFSQTQTALDQPTNLFSFTEEEQMFRDVVARYATEKVLPKVSEMDEKEFMYPEIIQGLFDNGLMGVEVDSEYGGAGGSFVSAITVVEELAKIDPSVSAMCDIHNTLVNRTVSDYASKELKEKYLTRLATDTVGSFCLTEAGSGSDAFALATRAEDRGDHYVLNGSKMWISNSAEAGIFVVFANVDPSKGYKGITCFMVEREMGVEIAKKELKLGIRASSTCVLNFDNVKVPKENVIGEVGKGYKYAIDVLNEGRIGIAAQMVGLAQGVFNVTMPYLFQRKQFGQPIGHFQGMQFQYAQIATEIECARLLTYNTARMREQGLDFVKEAAMAKLYACQVAERAASKCVEWMGGIGFTREFPAEKFLRDSKIGSIYEGTSNIQLQTIAKALVKQYSQ
ncbi:acyl-CoA dehydrogenase NM domain-like protein [Basidiobolus meristosporus CBS 931.73]|uniref:Short/branched chain specific acyl-CoA dehydrogenase, mitochondrial n=1 Tax=Basidiobolus meristosporus CBS 931.73 TaxID=1314790 RepID=A0A1Y1X9Q6_9FUNG|nr:acyl-CoA dehydrogenase NM domain-like protein [Basidiobolus meristosporus CBS 931.73]|eukprot:ORX82490.1 acyl-CoA dehydrogenase NM domain-like protein [Basidiobolus meristosporus CBS 931.73]